MDIQRDVDAPRSIFEFPYAPKDVYSWLTECKRAIASFILKEDIVIEFLEDGKPPKRVGLPCGVFYGSNHFVARLISLLEDSGAEFLGVSLMLPEQVATDLDRYAEEGLQTFLLAPPRGRRYASIFRPWRVCPLWPIPDRIRKRARGGVIPYELARVAGLKASSIHEGLFAEIR